MSQVRKEKKLKIADVQLSREEYLNLYRTMTLISSIALHDVAHPLDAARMGMALIQHDIKELEAGFLNTPPTPEINKRFEDLDAMLDLVIRSINETKKMLFAFLSPFVGPDPEEVFVSKPINIINQIIEGHHDVEIQIGKKCLRSLEIIYPENILFGMLSEIINNAVKHCSKGCKIWVVWRVKNSRFQCEVHDDGKGIVPGLERSFLTAGDLGSKLKESSGIDIVDRLVYLSDGKLLFARSKYLGGTLVLLDLPIHAYYKKGQLYELHNT